MHIHTHTHFHTQVLFTYNIVFFKYLNASTLQHIKVLEIQVDHDSHFRF